MKKIRADKTREVQHNSIHKKQAFKVNQEITKWETNTRNKENPEKSPKHKPNHQTLTGACETKATWKFNDSFLLGEH